MATIRLRFTVESIKSEDADRLTMQLLPEFTEEEKKKLQHYLSAITFYKDQFKKLGKPTVGDTITLDIDLISESVVEIGDTLAVYGPDSKEDKESE